MRYTIGFDFGSLTVRGVLMELETGLVRATAVYDYPHGIMTERLPDGTPLEPDWALQDPEDYLQGLRCVVKQLLGHSGILPSEVIGIGLDTTSCTMLPTTLDGTPLCVLPQYRSTPHAYMKLWKHHAAQGYAKKIEELARTRGEAWLAQCGGKVSSEHYLPKCMQIACEAPLLFTDAARLLQVGDWLVWKLTGQETRGFCTAAFKCSYRSPEGDIRRSFLAELHPLLWNLPDKQPGRVVHDGCTAGVLTQEAAAWLELCPGTAVSASAIDAHVTLLGSHIAEANQLLMIVGTSACQLVMSPLCRDIPGLNGVVPDALLPGMAVYEGGQSCVGDLFAWFVDRCVPSAYAARAEAAQISLHELLTSLAARLSPGSSGILALDWWNGVRSTLLDFDLSGLILGLRLDTRPEELYRALLESTAYGLRRILQTMEEHGLRIEALYATGGIAQKNPLLMQIYADVCGREICIVEQEQTGALGSAMLGAAAALYGETGADHLRELIERYRQPVKTRYQPDPAAAAVYQELYGMYSELYTKFGTQSSLMKRLKQLRQGNLRE